ncbi:hypothetical protein DICVIV_02845 [Dictyocaulus viviparus]|uniref:Uncharacterized protein n=1 Tax=Dictyocaulus viviparus TaxID=29172 RepID=A0A0D8Y471_DICVI|nr:hypothetical protein DICVIV_02845 [Dictyocaulus viviparus]
MKKNSLLSVNLFTKRLCSKTGAKYSHEMSRAPLIICIDPEFSMLNRFFKQAEPERKSTSIYDEVDSNALLDLYGNELPVKVSCFYFYLCLKLDGIGNYNFIKVEAWNVGPAVFKPRFSRRNVKMREQQSS